jgi:hypothetical protein
MLTTGDFGRRDAARTKAAIDRESLMIQARLVVRRSSRAHPCLSRRHIAVYPPDDIETSFLRPVPWLSARPPDLSLGRSSAAAMPILHPSSIIEKSDDDTHQLPP